MEYSEIKFALYARKSTEDKEKQVHSIEDQLRLMLERAKTLGIAVGKSDMYTESKSARKPNIRPEFARLMSDVSMGKYGGILVWDGSRLSRNPQDSGLIQQLLQDEVIKCIITRDKQYLPGDNAIVLSVDMGMSNQFVRDLMVNVRRGMYSRAARGWLPVVPPCGYKNDRENKTIVVDDERFPLVRQAWDMMLTGNYTVAQIARITDEEWGLRTIQRKQRGGTPLSVSGLYYMFRNPFFAGTVTYGGKVSKGLHPAMVSQHEFDRVQALLSRKTNPRPSLEQATDPFPYRGIIKCGECGCSITYTRKIKKQQNGNVHVFEYCYCTRRRKDYLCTQRITCTPAELTEQIRDELKKYTIIDDFFQWACEYLDEFNEQEVQDQAAVFKNQTKAIETLEHEVRELGRMRYRGQVDDAFYEQEKQTLENKLEVLRAQFEQQEEHNKEHRQALDKYFNFARYALEDFEGDDDAKKREVLSVVGQNLLYKDGLLVFEPIKYLAPVVEKYPELEKRYVSVGTSQKQGYGIDKSSVKFDWCTRRDSNSRPLAPQANALSS